VSNIRHILNERTNSYGTFLEEAHISQELKAAMELGRNWSILPCDIKQSLEMVCVKVARILNGNYNYKDNFVDCIGYLQLVLDRLEKEYPEK
jgi:hypothetical protein